MKDEDHEMGVILPNQALPLSIGERKVTSWRNLRDRIAPQGTAVQAKLLVDRTFTIIRYRPYQSQFAGRREVVYWIVALTDDGELFNTTLGGEAVCDVLDSINKLESDLKEAMAHGDTGRVKDLQELGAGSLWQFTLRWSESGANQGYYFFD